MAELANHTGDNEKGQTGLLSRLSLSAGRDGQLSNYFIEDMKAIQDY